MQREKLKWVNPFRISTQTNASIIRTIRERILSRGRDVQFALFRVIFGKSQPNSRDASSTMVLSTSESTALLKSTRATKSSLGWSSTREAIVDSISPADEADDHATKDEIATQSAWFTAELFSDSRSYVTRRCKGRPTVDEWLPRKPGEFAARCRHSNSEILRDEV